MAKRYKYKLSVLRDLGWTIWDPIGLIDERAHCEDEYDAYLLQIISKLSIDVPHSLIVDYLVDIEQNYIGMGSNSSIRRRAQELLDAIIEYQTTLVE